MPLLELLSEGTVPASGRTLRATGEYGRPRAGSRWHASRAWWGMHNPLRQQLLDQVLHVIAQARPLVAAVARRDRDLASQIRRALSSVALNLSEGFGSASGNARLRFESARGSL